MAHFATQNAAPVLGKLQSAHETHMRNETQHSKFSPTLPFACASVGRRRRFALRGGGDVARHLVPGELELALVVALEQGGAVRVQVAQVDVVRLGVVHCVSALLAHVHLRAPLFVGVLEREAVHLLAVTLERASLGERLVTVGALVWTHT